MQRSLLVSLITLALATAGCLGGDDSDGEPDGGDNGNGDGGQGTPPPTYDPAPMGSELTSTEIQQLMLAFSDNPLKGGQEPWPGHLIKWVNDDTFVLLHFDNDDVSQATQMLWMGLGVRGVFCAEDQPTPDFTHFHQWDAPTYAEGHGGDANEEGFWLLHVNVRQFESPFGDTGPPGVDESFGPTAASACGADYTPASHDPPNSNGLDLAERQALALALDDNPLRGGQEPWPGHLIKWVSEETFVLMHFNEDDPTSTNPDTTNLWAGIGHRSTFCQDTQPDEDFTHFHRSHAETYAAGHGGGPHQPGYWLLHLATHDFESPFGQTGGPGVDSMFGPTPAPVC